MGYIVIEGRNFEKARKEIKQNQDKTIIFSNEDEELNRKILEKECVNILLLNQSNKKDRLKQRDSGFNHVLAKMAKAKNVTIGINLDEIIHSDKKNKAKILGRIRQNIKLCKKAKLKMMFFSEKENRNSLDLNALGLVLGMPTWMLKEFQ
ncbi:MAG: RNase P subunit p30 family protein [Nanoarchaeota archaeon]|nr:RNase P subunit p30 family protein [Nanoarchaeota archaeon]